MTKIFIKMSIWSYYTESRTVKSVRKIKIEYNCEIVELILTQMKVSTHNTF